MAAVVALLGIWGVVAVFVLLVRYTGPVCDEILMHRQAVEGRKIWIPLKRAKKDWQLAKVPDFVEFLDETLAVKEEGMEKEGVKDTGPRKQKMKWRIEYDSNQPLLQRWDQYLSQYNLDDQDDEIVQGIKANLVKKMKKKAISPRIPRLELPATEESICCFPFFWETFAKLKNAASRRFEHPLLDPFKALLKADIDIANRAAKDLFDDSQKENRLLRKKRRQRHYCVLSSEEVQDSFWDKKTVAEEWTHLELRADTPNFSSSGKALKHVEKLCGGRLIPMDSQTEDSWTVRVGALWFLLFQVIRQSGLPLDESFDLFSKAANESCEWKLPDVEDARSRAHKILAESRTWPLVRQVSHAFLRASDRYGGLLLPLGWSTDEISDKMWIDRIFKETMVSEFQYALRLDPPPPEISSIEEISHLLRQRNFASFHVEFSAHLREVVDDEWRMMLAKNVSAKAVAA